MGGLPCAVGRSDVLSADGAGVAEGRGQAVLLDGVVRAEKIGAGIHMELVQLPIKDEHSVVICRGQLSDDHNIFLLHGSCE